LDISKIPNALSKHFNNIFQEDVNAFLDALSGNEQTAIRLNPLKHTEEEIFPSGNEIRWEKNGRILPHRPSFIYDPLWHAGTYYVQESSSMFMTYLLREGGLFKKSINVLDACAAPGGKTTQLLAELPPDSLVVANEIISKRNKILIENITRWGYPNIVITQSELRAFAALPGFFDLVVLDAPCSGEGMMRRDSAIADEWSEKVVGTCAIRQSSLIKDIIPSVKPGGFLLYSTCTYEPAENEQQIELLLCNGFSQPDSIQAVGQSFEEITPITIEQGGKKAFAQRFDLHKTKGSGFFCCLLQKDAIRDEPRNNTFNRYSNAPLCQMDENKLPVQWVKNNLELTALRKMDDLYYLQKGLLHRFRAIYGSVKCTYFGVLAGHYKGELLIPAHPLALSVIKNNAHPSIEVTMDQAIHFLKREPFTSETTFPKGWCIITYKQHALGWIKNIAGGRINNYLPVDWRILK